MRLRRRGRRPAPDWSVREVLLDGPWRHREITANGIRFHLAVGSRFAHDRPLALLLHGFGEFWWAWRHQITALDAAGISVAAVDLRGYAATDKTPRGYRQSVTGLDVSAVIRSLGFEAATVVGHDWGGIAAWSTHAYAPEQVSALATIGAPHPLRFPWRSMGPGLAWSQLPILPERMITARAGAYVEWLLRHRTATGGSFPTVEEARHYRRALRLWPSPHCALEYLRMFGRDQLRAAGRAYRRALAVPVEVAVLSVRGSADPLVPASAMLPPPPYAPDPTAHRHLEIDGAGHFPHEESPDAVSGALVAWLTGLAGRRSTSQGHH
ncbi:MAG TPA: alpha/beta hydrolase [Candidatus Nanopelagicales bacterium]|nr:alpha/beta hydrolase [Candidatus Nanopelagicales bacterium]